MTMPMPSSDNSWSGLLSAGLQIGGLIYQGQILKRQQRQAAKMAIGGGGGGLPMDFPQLGMGLAASGPQRSSVGSPALGFGAGGTRFGIFDSSGAGVGYSSGGGTMQLDDGSSGNVQVMRGSRFPTQLVVYTTPSGNMRVGGYRSIGTPMLWSGDFAAVKRVARVARKLGRFVRHRSSGRRRFR